MSLVIYEGSFKSEQVLQLEPWVINWAELRLAVAHAVLFW
jgi:hypothetical protein